MKNKNYNLRNYYELRQNKRKGEVFTPTFLVLDMLNHLPEDVWESMVSTFCDYCAGSGTFVIEIIKKLKEYGHSDENIANRIWVYEINPKWFNRLKLIKIGVYNIQHVYCIDSLKLDWKNMPNFDVVVGNPPYLKGLHLKFLKIAIECSKQYVCFIQPATWILNEKPNQRDGIERDLKNLISTYKTKMYLYNGNSLFYNLGLGTYLVVSFINKKENSDFIIVNDSVSNQIYKYNNIDNISKYGNDKIYLSLKTKILSFSDNLDNHRRDKNVKKYIVNISQIRGHVSNIHNKVFDDDFYTFIPRDKTVDVEVTHDIYFSFDKNLYAQNFINYLKTNFSRFCLSIYKINSQLIKGELAAVPWLDFSQEWTDEKLYKYFNLTEEEINFIETNIPKYY